jgi:transcriptional regulator NrdR family protein
VSNARKCPNCGEQTRVIDVRDEGKRTVRDRQCRACGHRHKTVEERAERGWVKVRS